MNSGDWWLLLIGAGLVLLITYTVGLARGFSRGWDKGYQAALDCEARRREHELDS